jgi:hypothetical protein
MNRMKIFKIALGLSIVAMAFSSCTEKFEELNTQPNALIAADLDAKVLGQVFANAQGRSLYGAPGGSTAGFQTAQSLFGDLYSQYFATTATNFDSDRYTQVGGWSNGAWTYFYQQAAPPIKFVEDFTLENDMPVENAIIKIWKVEAYHRITDYWGPIIYSEFGNGKTSVNYDTQESVYRDFFVKLDEAVAVLKANPGATAFIGHDQLYNQEGNVDKWLKFANSLRLRLAMRVKYADPALAKTEAEKAIDDGVMLDNTHSALLATTTNSRNPYWIITDWGEFRMSALMESVLKGYNDPRLPVYFSPIVGLDTDKDGVVSEAERDPDGDGSLYEGMRNGFRKVDLNQPALNAANSDMGPAFLNQGRGGSAAGPALRVLSTSEVYFLRAEGALENWDMGGTAQELYNKGIEMSLKESRIGAPDADVAAYIASTNTPIPVNDAYSTPASSDITVAFMTAGSKEKQLEQIITQKWIALYPDGWEAWAELRRTKYPIPFARIASDNTDVPKEQTISRLIFVTGEYSSNLVAVQAAEKFPELAGGNKNSTRLWWDAKP